MSPQGDSRGLGLIPLLGRFRNRLAGRHATNPPHRSAPADGDVAVSMPSKSPNRSPRIRSREDAGTGTAGLSGATFTAADLIGLRTRAADLSLHSGHTRRGARQGARAARFRGRGMTYAESRIYMPGDDARRIDWRVTARAGRVHTKLFDEERDRPILFVVDLGEHMRFGSRRAFKSVVAAEAASLLAWAALADGDRVGALAVADDHVAQSRFMRGRRGVLAVFRMLAGAGKARRNPHAASGIREALPRVRDVAGSGALVILISDFSGRADPSGSDIASLRTRSDLVCVWIHDELEEAPPPPARYPIGDGRSTAILDTRSHEVACAVTNRFTGIERWLSDCCRGEGAALVRIRCGDDVHGVLRESFAGPTRRRGGARW